MRTPPKSRNTRPRHATETGAPRRVPLRIGILCSAGWGNFGNDASLLAVAETLSRMHPDAVLVSISSRPQIVTARHGLEAINVVSERPSLTWLPRQLRRVPLAMYRVVDLVRAFTIVGEFDALVVSGTGMLDDFLGERTSSWPFFVLSWFAVARLRGVSTALLSIGAGPISSGIGRRVAGWIGRLSDYQSYRDDSSRLFMIAQGASPARALRAPDVVFGLDALMTANPESGHTPPKRLAVIAVMNYRGWLPGEVGSGRIRAQMLTDLTEVTAWLVGRGYQVRLISADDSDGGVLSDLAASVRAALPASVIDHISVTVTSDLVDAARHMADAAFVVATRFHAVVAALMSGVPAISLGYATKNAELLEQMGLPGFAQDVEAVDLDRFKRMVVRLETEHDEIVATIRGEVIRMRRELLSQLEFVDSTLLRRARQDFRV